MDQYSHYKRPQKRGLNSGKVAIFVVAIGLATGGYLIYDNQRYNYLINTPVDISDHNQISLQIKKGESISEITKDLKQKSLILDDNALSKYLKNNGLDKKIVTGRFYLEKSQTIIEIAQELTNEQKSQAVVTIPEGSRIVDIDKKLTSLNLIKDGEFTKAVKSFDNYQKYKYVKKENNSSLIYPLEGYLFPDTYFVDRNNFKPEDLISMMLNNFEKKYAQALTNANTQRTTKDIVIMASIIEKEVRTSKDIPIVAGILWKRLDQNWQIGADATLLYLSDDRELDYKDLKENSPYNTRKNTGLPPGPICNPGIKAIEAAMSPKDSPYYYYLTTLDTGEVIYAKTNEEHNQNKAKYL